VSEKQAPNTNLSHDYIDTVTKSDRVTFKRSRPAPKSTVADKSVITRSMTTVSSPAPPVNSSDPNSARFRTRKSLPSPKLAETNRRRSIG
jgi:hypothetical protein